MALTEPQEYLDGFKEIRDDPKDYLTSGVRVRLSGAESITVKDDWADALAYSMVTTKDEVATSTIRTSLPYASMPTPYTQQVNEIMTAIDKIAHDKTLSGEVVVAALQALSTMYVASRSTPT